MNSAMMGLSSFAMEHGTCRSLIIHGNNKEPKVGSRDSQFFKLAAMEGGMGTVACACSVEIRHFVLTGGQFVEMSVGPNLGGGAIQVGKNSQLIIRGCKFKRSKTLRLGGAILAGENSHVQIFDTEFSNNECAGAGEVFVGSGGAIHAGNSNAMVEIYASNFTSNRAKIGGAISAQDGSVVVLRSCRFALNNATGPAGNTEGNDFFKQAVWLAADDPKYQSDVLFVDAASTVLLGDSYVSKDGLQQNHFAEGSLLVRNTELLVAKAALSTASSLPLVTTAGLCPAFSDQSIVWCCRLDDRGECVGSPSTPEVCVAGTKPSIHQSNPGVLYPWGITCSECKASTTKVGTSYGTVYPFLGSGCECPAGRAGTECTPCPSGTYGWTGQRSSSGFLDKARAALGVFASLDRF
jgi:predicted outer membrane repeat protein